MTPDQEYELETPTVWQRIFLKSKVNGAPYEEQEGGSKWCWPENTYLQRRLEYLRTYRSPDGTLISLFRTEVWEPGQRSQTDMTAPELAGRGESRSKDPQPLPFLVHERDAVAPVERAEAVPSGSAPGNGASLGTNRNRKRFICIDIPSDDWTWCANPTSVTPSYA
jgi:hypothetical protein